MCPPILEPAGILTAVREELLPISRRMRPRRWDSAPIPHSDGPLGPLSLRCCIGSLGGVQAVAARSGMGVVRAQHAAQCLIRQYHIQCLVIAGFASGLRRGVSPGTLVVADGVLWPASSPSEACNAGESGICLARPDPVMLDAALHTSASSPVVAGGILTLYELLSDPSAKASAGNLAPGAVAADMETAGAVWAAIEAGIPWIAVRCITDGAHDKMPLPFDRYIGPDGEVSRARLPAAILRAPTSLAGLARLGVRSLRGAGKLAAFVEELLQNLRSRQ